MASVEPAGGSTVTTATARNAKARTARTGGRAPRETAVSPAITPAQPTAIAAHSDTVTTVAVRCSACHQGGPPGARGNSGTATFGPAAEMTTTITVAAAMAAAASQARKPVSRAERGEAAGPTGVLPSPSFPLTNPPARSS